MNKKTFNYYINLPVKELKKEYTRLRDIAVKRVKRLQNSEYKDYQSAQFYPLKLGEMDINDIFYNFSELYHFVYKEMSTIKQIKNYEKRTIETLKAHNYDIDFTNLKQYGDFMDEMRSINQGRLFASDFYYETFIALEKRGLSPQRFTRLFKGYMNNLNKVIEINKLLNNKISYNRIKDILK